MAQFETTETQVLAVSATPIVATFDGGIQSVVFTTPAVDVFVDFDRPITAGSLLLKANTTTNQYVLGNGNVKQIYAKAASGSGNLYILGIRG